MLNKFWQRVMVTIWQKSEYHLFLTATKNTFCMRKYTIYVVTIFTAVVLLFQSSEVRTNSVQPPAGRTGAPDELTCGDGGACHNATPNTGSGSVLIAFSGNNNEYIPGATYEVTVTVIDADASKFGFECTSVDVNGDGAGTWSTVVQGNVAYPTASAVNDREYVSHFMANSNNTWIINWIAPALDEGAITFYASGNGANGNSSNTGDNIYTSSLVINNATGIEALAQSNPFVIENLSHDQLNVQYFSEDHNPVVFHLYNLSGKCLKSFEVDNQSSTTHSTSLDVSSIPNGFYIMQYVSGTIAASHKIVIQ